MEEYGRYDFLHQRQYLQPWNEHIQIRVTYFVIYLPGAQKIFHPSWTFLKVKTVMEELR
jgi:hypothetical protein